MMPGRTRRVRLLAVVVCIVTVFFLYTRNEARVGQYADYVRSKTPIGGGAVLREPEKQRPEPLGAPLHEPSLPDAKSTTEAVLLEVQETSAAWRDEVVKTPKPTTAPAPTSTSIAKARPTEKSTTLAYIPPFDDPEELPIEVGDGRVEEEYDAYIHTSTYVPIHWTKLPEKFPVTSTIQLPTAKPSAIPRIQKQGKGTADVQRLAAVREAAQWAWKGFRENGWDFDEVKPISGFGSNTFNGWGATLVDSLDTLWIMGLKDDFEDAVNKTSQIDFTTSSRNDIPMFEVTIRYLGGLLGAYDVSGKKYKVLLDKAVELAEILYSAFDTPNRMPETYYYWKPTFAKNAHRASTRIVMAELGTLSLEFTRLAQLTLEPKYYDAIARITDEFEKWQNNTRLPGMWPTTMDASGCEKPVYHPPPVHQVPIPGGDTYMMTTEPVKVDPKVQKAAEDALNESNAGSAAGAYGVVNPKPYPGAASATDSLRHPMEDEYVPNGFGSGAAGSKATNEHNAKEPLRHDAGSDFGVNAATEYGTGQHEPVPPQGGSGDLNKRQFEDYGATVAQTGSKPKTKPTHGTKSHHNEDATTAASNEPEELCIPQGFASSSRNSPETFTLGGQSDSTYEYLPKEFLLLGGRLDQYKTMYLDSMKPIIEKLIFRPMTPDNLDILVSGELRIQRNYTTDEWYETHVAKNEHLTCFVGGMVGMGGKIFHIPEHVEIARKLTDGCIWSYNATGSGIMPESYRLSACDSWTDCKWNQTKYEDELDPYAEFREDQRAEFKESYMIDDLEAYEKELAVASSSIAAELAAAATATPTAIKAPSPAELNAAEDVHTFGEFGGTSKLRKRQQIDDRIAIGGAPPLPQPQPLRAPTASPSATPDFAAAADSDDVWNEFSPYSSGTPTTDNDDDDVVPYPTTAIRPAYTPPPPMTHQQYVTHKIETERLPKGFTRLDSKSYILRPEAIESVFYMYRITGEQYWRDMGWNMFMAIEKATHAPYGHSRIDDVTKEIPDQTDGMESFWIAETLKYFYLLFDEPETWSLDDWVLNTEAHFFRRPDAGVGSGTEAA